MRVEFPLWKRTVKINGEEVSILSGPGLSGYEITIWPVRDRKGDRSPTHQLVVQERRERNGADGGGGAGGDQAPF